MSKRGILRYTLKFSKLCATFHGLRKLVGPAGANSARYGFAVGGVCNNSVWYGH